MKFALFYEIPVARPWDAESEHRAYKNTLEQAVLGDQVGFHSFWTVEHHFLEEYSHCSNPEVLYGAIAARTKNIRIGYGVRLLPKPYNHPIRTAESVAVLDLLSDGRVEFGTGRSSTRAELEGFDIDPHETRAMWQEALEHIVGRWTERGVPGRRQVLADGRAPARAAEAAPEAAPADVGRDDQPRRPPRDRAARPRAVLVHRRRAARGARRADRACTARASPSATNPVGKFVNDRAATFTMVHCAPTKERGVRRRRRVVRLVRPARRPAHRLGRRAARGQGPRHLPVRRRAARSTTGPARSASSTSTTSTSIGSAVVGDPDECIETAKRYEAAGCDLLLCLVNPYKIPHEKVMRSIELIGKHVIPAFR